MTIDARTSRDTETALGRLAEMFVTFQGEGPHAGKRHVFLRLAGCEVGCRFCDTPDALRGGREFSVRRDSSANVEVLPNPVAADSVAAIVDSIARANAPIHAISVTGGEPLEQPEFLADLLPRLAPRAVLLETAGVHPEALERIVHHVAIVSMDLKMPSVAKIAPQWDAHARFLDVALAADREVYVKVIVSPALDAAEFRTAVDLVARRDASVPFVIQPETDRKRVVTCGFDFLFELARVANERGLRDVRVLPQIHKFLAAP